MSAFSRRDFLKFSSAVFGSAVVSRFGLGGRILPADGANRPNVLILLFDTTTAPHLSLYGYPRQTTPNMERFAQRAVVYHAHHSTGTYTTPGTASILTGLLPWTHRAVNPGALIRRDLVENNFFRAVGPDYYRIAYAQNFWADLYLRQFYEDIELHLPATSFAYPNPLVLGDQATRDPIPYFAYEDFLVGGIKLDTPYPGSLTLGILDVVVGRGRNLSPELRRADPKSIPSNVHFYYQNRTVFDGLFEVLQNASLSGRPFFAYFHLWSPHGPYAPTREFSNLFDDGFKVPRKPRHPLIPKKQAVADQALDRFSRAYDQYVANVDAEFGRLMERLDAAGLLANTVVVVLSDHGQLFERGVHGHASPLLYDQGIHIPLLISAPGQTERRDIYVPTSNVDILPTLAALTGGQPPQRLDGQVLPGFGGPETERPVFCVEAKESSAFRPLNRASFVLIRGARKLIWYSGYPETEDLVELYDLQEDPLELNDLSSADPLTTKRMLEELKAARKAADEPYK